MREYFLSLLFSLREPFAALGSPDRRIFWPFLLSSAVLATWVWARHVRGKRGLLSYLLAREVWLHPSSRLDVAIIFARAVLRAATFGTFVVGTLGVAASTAYHLRSIFGVAEPSSLSQAAVTTLFTVAVFVADDFTRYVVHRAMHRVPALWEIHKVHHSAEVLTPLTIYRIHPVEGFVNGVRATLTVGAVTGVFFHFFAGRVRGWEILGVDVLGFVFTISGANLRHSQVFISFGRVLEHLLISPAQHQVHHSVDPRHHDRNFGSALAIWDWMFGSLYVLRGHEKLRFGLPEEARNHDRRLISVLVGPLVAAASALVRDRSSRPPAASAASPVEPRTVAATPDTPGR